MKVFIDANLLIYLNVLDDASARMIYENFYIDLLTKFKAYTDPIVLDELLFISRKKANIPYDATIQFIESIVKPYITILPIGEKEYDLAKNIIVKYGIKPSDALHIATMKNNNIENIASEDKEFDKINNIKRLWPLTPKY